jgi:hypothetical protein
MPPHYRSVAPFAAVLGILVLASDLQAAPKMYSASLILHDFANDTTSGTRPTEARPATRPRCTGGPRSPDPAPR